MLMTNEKEKALNEQLEKVNQNMKVLKDAFPLEEAKELLKSINELTSMVNEFGGYDGQEGVNPNRSRCEFNIWHDSQLLANHIRNRVNGLYGFEKDADKCMNNIHRWIDENKK
ncbi:MULTISPECIES: hypothetical protein [Bacillus cereus group]|uniref:Uncharacterized protein n=1 Tax=Bacillus thuringiensis TaxID=1428 RepID=A0A9X6WJN5_BACTU|nr:MULTISPECIES: hypothetical protein [Bacillus cereus group]PFJ33207.1 hypothetical protein COJ15_28610 [Bacillus thuringiensis]PGP14454.1 hypothetical protein COA01_29250 [Bacillus cereus]